MDIDTKKESIKNYVLTMFEGQVREPDKIELHMEDTLTHTGTGEINITEINIKVADDDIGLALGKGGKVADSVRLLMSRHAKNIGYEYLVSLRVDTPPRPKNHFYKAEQNVE